MFTHELSVILHGFLKKPFTIHARTYTDLPSNEKHHEVNKFYENKFTVYLFEFTPADVLGLGWISGNWTKSDPVSFRIPGTELYTRKIESFFFFQDSIA